MSTTMLYKYPGPHEIHGGLYDYTIVEDEQIEAAQADGWKLTTAEAKKAHEDLLEAQAAERERLAEAAAAKALADPNAPPTRAELEQMATKLGLPFNGRTSDRKLADMIKAATESGDAAPVAASPAPAAPVAEAAAATAAAADPAAQV